MKCSIACPYRLLHPLGKTWGHPPSLCRRGAGQELTRYNVQGSEGVEGSPVCRFWPRPEPAWFLRLWDQSSRHTCAAPLQTVVRPEQKHEALVHTTVIKHTHFSANQVTGKGKTDSRRAGSQPSTSRPWDIYHKLTFCWLIRKRTGQLSPIQKPWEKRKFHETLAKGILLASWVSNPFNVQLRALAAGCCDPGCYGRKTCLLSFPPVQRSGQLQQRLCFVGYDKRDRNTLQPQPSAGKGSHFSCDTAKEGRVWSVPGRCFNSSKALCKFSLHLHNSPGSYEAAIKQIYNRCSYNLSYNWCTCIWIHGHGFWI